MGRALHADPRVQRSGRGAAQEWVARRAARQRLLRLHQPLVVPTAARRSPRRVPAVRESRLARQVTSARRPDAHPESESPDVPGFGTWRAIYWFVFGWFVLVVVLLTVFTEMLS